MSATTSQADPRLPSAADFIRRLEGLDNGAVAELRRSLGFSPGTHHRAFPAVEPFVRNREGWPREAHYLLAGLWASVNTASARAARQPADVSAPAEAAASPADDAATPLAADAGAVPRNLGHAIGRLYNDRGKPPSIERRFIALLDADDEQLPDRLRQIVRLLDSDEIPIAWPQLLIDLLDWRRDDRRVQQRWARAFYRAFD